MAAGHFRVEYEERPEGGQVARLTMDNAAKLNSLNSGLMQEIIDKMTGVAADPELRRRNPDPRRRSLLCRGRRHIRDRCG